MALLLFEAPHMTIRSAILSVLVGVSISACVSDEPVPFAFEDATPVQSGKSDEPAACGQETCARSLCGYDCTTQGEQCERSCATADTRPATFVAASVVGGASFDSRANPYAPVYSLDNVLVYGCNVWDYSDGAYDGFEIQYKEVIHSSFFSNPDDPTRFSNDLRIYVGPFTGPGSYRAQAQYARSHASVAFASDDACSVDVLADASAGLTGRFDCTIPNRHNTMSVTVHGTFACGESSMSPIFSRWAAAPQ